MVREEISELTSQMDQQGEELKVLLLPSDPLDERNIMLEVRSGFFYAFHLARNAVIPLTVPLVWECQRVSGHVGLDGIPGRRTCV